MEACFGVLGHVLDLRKYILFLLQIGEGWGGWGGGGVGGEGAVPGLHVHCSSIRITPDGSKRTQGDSDSK